jgi:hypothetical protein
VLDGEALGIDGSGPHDDAPPGRTASIAFVSVSGVLSS